MAGRVAVVDHGMGNLRSVVKALEHVAGTGRVILARSAADLAAASRVVVPGQGALPDCMRELSQRGLREAVIEAAATKPLLGICVGLQLLFEQGEEGKDGKDGHTAGLGILPGRVPRFPRESMYAADGSRLKVPHMGWNTVQQCQAHPLWADIADESRFYFVHGYHVALAPADASLRAGLTHYGIPFTSAVARDNIFAVQFHPEKSARDGLQLLANFMRWQP